MVLKKKQLAYVEDEGSNINNMNDVLKLVVNCEALGLEESYKGTCFWHSFSKHANVQLLMNFFVKD